MLLVNIVLNILLAILVDGYAKVKGKATINILHSCTVNRIYQRSL